MTSIEARAKLKQDVISHWRAIDSGIEKSPLGISSGFKAWLHEPIGLLFTWGDFQTRFLSPLSECFGPLHREIHLCFAGFSNGRRDGDISKDGALWVTGTGLLHGTFNAEYLGLKPTKLPVQIRWGEFLKFENGLLVEIFLMHDLVDFCEQIERPILPRPRGYAAIYPRPAMGDGIQLREVSEEVSAFSLEHIRDFLFNGLNSYDQTSLKSMGMERFFHPKIAWYGPGGIGACFGLKAFQADHQAHWLHAFPDRQVQDLTALFAEGLYSGAPGWGAVLATHQGEYLGTQGTGASLSINGLDWWKRAGDQYVENWVFVDMIHLFQQMGVDLLARARP
jgi:hypothetical protein